ncbi:peptide/nickel transport system substrate-binding protein [Nocardioides zeae]|uniref:Peptide/nickel transport system substrate-binding protein n=1 Tax=Nocardioides zeae TaxID=1457234 RepID=A0ACC6IEE1_9ACTN|nr:ABC transporter substrate-binding protein [Nocardioides zeae]MDR6174213.1 peptide/nickel transport system substrate-binding protein [Nocardioides zeae]MDR6209020.1 peptide/nickel transport system substrate-binding protein [Nocardioides zeae]
MSRTLQSRLAALVGLVLALCLSGCMVGSDSSPTASSKDLRIAVNLADMASLDLARVSADAMLAVVPLFGQTLVSVDPDDVTQLEPLLAESWEVSDDASSVTFTLRQDVTFSTGRPMTAEDVKFSFDRVKNIQGAPSDKLQSVSEITVVDDHTVRFDLVAPDSGFVASTATLFFAIMDSQEVIAQGGASDADAVSTDDAQSFLDANTVGTGPYQLRDWRRNEQAVFEPNPEYWGDEEPAFETITFADIREPATQAQLVQRGDVDVALDIDADTAAGLQSSSGAEVLTTPSFNLIYMALNNGSADVPAFGDLRVRQAVQKVIDYDGISQAFTQDSPRPAAAVPLGFLGADDVEPVDTDVEGARALMAEAGYEDGFDVQVSFANVVQYGVPLNALWEKLASDLAQINIDLTLQPTEFDSWIEAYRAGDLPMTSSFYGPDFFDTSMFIDPLGRNDGVVAQRVDMDIPGNQALFDEYKASTDQTLREELATQMITAMRDDASIIAIVQPKKIIVHRDDLSGVAYSPTSNVTVLDISRS